MTSENTRPVWMAQRAIALQLLRDDHPEQWTRAELRRKASDFDAGAFADGLAQLVAEGVAIVDGKTISASRCARHLDWLELVSI